MQIRRSVFETNSSSTHSLVISEGTDFITVDDERKVINIKTGEFGWGPDHLYHWESRASYLYTYCVGHRYEKKFKTLLRNVIQDYTKKKVRFIKDDPDSFGGYIDHQSAGVGGEVFYADDAYDQIKALLFGKNSCIIIDHDNH